MQLRDLALLENDLCIAKRCATAVGDVALSKYLAEIITLSSMEERGTGLPAVDQYVVRSKMALLQKDLKKAEMILLQYGKVDECIKMYRNLQKHAEAIRVAEQNRHSEAHEMRQAYFQLLMDTHQEEQAASLKAEEGDVVLAVNLYLKAGLPGQAGRVITDNNIMQPVQLLESVANALSRAGMHDVAGEFFERLNESQKALDSYVRGRAYRKAVELARRSFPSLVVDLQNRWGDFLLSTKQVEMAINHYIEAKEFRKATEAALGARQYNRALQLTEALEGNVAYPYFKRIGWYFEETGQFEQAERCYLSANEGQLALEMYMINHICQFLSILIYLAYFCHFP